MVKCPYKDDCTSYPYKCDTCRHNTSKKKDYYEPDYDDWYWYWYPRRYRRRYPYEYPLYPYTEPWVITYGNTSIDSGTIGTTIMYDMNSKTSNKKKKKKDHYKSR